MKLKWNNISSPYINKNFPYIDKRMKYNFLRNNVTSKIRMPKKKYYENILNKKNAFKINLEKYLKQFD